MSELRERVAKIVAYLDDHGYEDHDDRLPDYLGRFLTAGDWRAILKRLRAPYESGRGCNVCGGALVRVRPSYPKGEPREVCPTCLQERTEQAIMVLSPATYQAEERSK